jgi:nicotinate dehydrogenase subunit B
MAADRRTPSRRVHDLPSPYVAHDCGQIVNPDGVRNQIEGCIIQTVGRVIKEAVTLDRSKVTSIDWASYPILTFAEIPDVVINLIDRPTEPPWGAGEPTCARSWRRQRMSCIPVLQPRQQAKLGLGPLK